MSKFFKEAKGQIGVGLVIVLAIAIVLVAAIVPTLNSISISGAIDRVIGQGYVVLAAGEYNLIQSKLDTLQLSANTAVTNAEAAVITSNETLTTLLLHNENEVHLYPESTSAIILLTAGGGADTFGAWAEVTTNTAVTFTSKFAADSGYVVEAMFSDYSKADRIYIVEFATANDGTHIIGRASVRSDWTYVSTLKSVRVIAGETVYYRMKSEDAGNTLRARFRYYYR